MNDYETVSRMKDYMLKEKVAITYEDLTFFACMGILMVNGYQRQGPNGIKAMQLATGDELLDPYTYMESVKKTLDRVSELMDHIDGDLRAHFPEHYELLDDTELKENVAQVLQLPIKPDDTIH